MQKRATLVRWAAGLVLMWALAAPSLAPQPSGSAPDAAYGRGRSGIIQRDGAGQVGDAAPHLAAGTPEERYPL